MKYQIPILECKRCGHKWIPRISNTVLCPKCRSARWNEEKKMIKNEGVINV